MLEQGRQQRFLFDACRARQVEIKRWTDEHTGPSIGADRQTTTLMTCSRVASFGTGLLLRGRLALAQLVRRNAATISS